MQLSETPKMKTLVARKAIHAVFSSSSKTLATSSSPEGTPTHSSPIHNCTVSQSMMEETIENAESIIMKWDPNSSSYTKITYLFQHNRKEAKEFLKSIKDLRRAMHLLISEHSHSRKLVLAQKLMQIAMARLEKEFYQILFSNHDKLDPESVSSRSSTMSSNSDFDDEIDPKDGPELGKAGESITEMERAAEMAMSDLKAIADCMISCGYGKECIKIYKQIRKSIVDEGLYMLEVEPYKISQIQRMSWETMELLIKKWVKAVKIAVTILFRGEQILCDHVFSTSETIRESCFYEITKEGATNLFRFPALVAKGKTSQERIFRLMELHETISDHWPDIELIFHSESMSTIKSQVRSSMHKLADSIGKMLLDFKSSVQKDSSKTLIPGGGIHPLTQSAMRFICSLAEHSKALSEILVEYPIPRNHLLLESYFENHTPTPSDEPILDASVHLAWLILVLLCRLDTKAELYKDVPLSYLFLANNLKFIIDEVYSTQLKNILGDYWVLRHINKVCSYASNYETTAWAKVWSCLPDETSELSPEEAKEQFRQFHVAFEEVYIKQSSWIVPDARLRDELKVSMAKKLLPEYKKFYEKYLEMLVEEKNLELLVRLGPDNLENYLSDLFYGSPILISSSSSSSSRSSQGCISG